MSFSSNIKAELATVLPESDCCVAAQAYAMAEYARSFSSQSVSLQTESEAVARCYARLLEVVCGVKPTVESPPPGKAGMITVAVPGTDGCRRVLARFGHDGREIGLRINRAVLECEACAAAFLRGVFLVCGTVTNPEVDYHLEFCVPYLNLCNDLVALLGEQGLVAKITRRKGNFVVYFKESEQIEDCLTRIGAVGATLELMNVKVVKDIRNHINRAANCENANMDKVIRAGVEQAQAAEKLVTARGWEAVPDDLRELCRLRMDNPGVSLRELGEQLEPPLTRSGVYHRMQRLMALAESVSAE